MTQTPAPGDFLVQWRGDVLKVELKLAKPRKGRAALRTNLGHAAVRRHEIIDETEKGLTPLARAWTDIPLKETAPGTFCAEIPLGEVGVFSGKACFFPEGEHVPEWPEGRNFHIKVESADTRKSNSIYCVFPRQFGSFREVVRRLPHIMDTMGFRIIQTLPPFPVPTTYAVMGEYGCPFAATDLMSVDPAMAEFDERATPLEQFKELIGAVHARHGLMFIDMPANHTGWASTLQTHHPEWFKRESDGRFHSPGAWGVTWADLVELDYSHPDLRAYMADVFLFWCRIGIDGFRCDAGYMIPPETWEYIVAKVRDEYPDTVFLLEGLGGPVATTGRLLSESNLDWAYSELFQTYDRNAFERYLPDALSGIGKFGTLVHFAETHDNDRLAKGGETYARLRVQLAALLSVQGAWGIANGVEWYCREKIDVHGKNDLCWGAAHNMVGLIAKLNRLLETHPSFSGLCKLSIVTRGGGNTLAVSRGGLLVLANLDCTNGTTIDWDRAAFGASEAIDILTGRKVECGGPVALGPGEVLCLDDGSPRTETVAAPTAQDDGDALFHVSLPRDLKRDIVVPAGEAVEVTADCAFRMRLIDPASGRTIRVFRSTERRIVFTAPHYEGDGTRCRLFDFDISRYVGGNRAERHRMRFLVPPPPDTARVKLALSGAEVRANPQYRAILSNGAGAAAQLRLGWGEIRSQYDAMLAANPNPDAPSDRINLWTRTRCWLQREGYLRELDAKCVTRALIDPSGHFAHWHFTVPCGMGRETAFAFTLSLAEGSNAARLSVKRLTAPECEVGDSVRIVFRPDVEWRSFHSKTKAYAGAEALFSEHCDALPDGFKFHPDDAGSFVMRVSGGAYHHEPQWTYSVAHPEEAERGQDGSGDLFSPGWISADLKVGDTMSITGIADFCANGAHASGQVRGLRFPEAEEFPDTLGFEDALRRALDLFVVKRDDLKTVIAGYPWFLDWGRDTFIFLRGMIAAGRICESVDILKAFAAFVEDGTMPNIIYGDTAGNRDTVDAPLWFVRCVQEVLATQKEKISATDRELLLATCNALVDGYIKGTPNGIKVDKESGLVWSPSHFTWMDTNYPACTPRIGYPVEIQALWISALRFLGRDAEADRAKASLERLFKWEHGYRDCLAAPNGEPAALATPEDTVRPNQLFLITLGVTDDKSIIRATEELLVPGGIRSLNAEHPLYRGAYTGDEDTSRKQAYHNGTVWAWPFPLYAEALDATGECTRDVAMSLLASAVENLNAGCVGHMSEIADGDSPHAQKGCCAQAWSVSELLRVWLKPNSRK